MKITQLTSENFCKWKSEICVLLKEASRNSFPNNYPSEEHFINTINRLETYVEQGKAIVFLLLDDMEELLLGWAWCHEIDRYNKKRIHVSSTAISAEYQHLGYGTFLFSEIESFARANHYDGIDLLVSESNKPAISFYLKNEMVVERYLMKKDFRLIE